MTTPVPLNTEAEACRKALADWVVQSQVPIDFVLDEKGNRIYSRNSIKSLVEPLLQAMGLPVSRHPRHGHSWAKICLEFGFHDVAVLGIYTDRSLSPSGALLYSDPDIFRAALNN